MPYPKFSVTMPFVTVFAAAIWSLYSPVAAQNFLVGHVRLARTSSNALAYASPAPSRRSCWGNRTATKTLRTSCGRRTILIASSP